MLNEVSAVRLLFCGEVGVCVRRAIPLFTVIIQLITVCGMYISTRPVRERMISSGVCVWRRRPLPSCRLKAMTHARSWSYDWAYWCSKRAAGFFPKSDATQYSPIRNPRISISYSNEAHEFRARQL